MLPESINKKVKGHFDADIADLNAVHGGDINNAAQITLDNGVNYFIKWNVNADPSMFSKEAKGLKILSEAESGLHIPNTVTFGESFLIMEWVNEGSKSKHSSFQFGRQLALLHKNTSDYFGLDHDNFIGKLHQSNTKHSNWSDFFAIERIEPQIQLAIENDKIERSLFRSIQKLYGKLGHIFPQEEPALLHGDLWSGNYMFDNNSNASIFDPAVYYGHREMDLSMTRLFGGFSGDFYDGYNEEYPVEEGFEDRIKLCNLYPILVHANLFGGSYSRQAEQIIHHYA
ncbi:MAG: fructosamine kinase family protein [Gracilimonas sp.]|nr:fructosamine kinase family protein [Gracilimonas sp.]